MLVYLPEGSLFFGQAHFLANRRGEFTNNMGILSCQLRFSERRGRFISQFNPCCPYRFFYYIRVGIKRPYDCILCLFPFSSLDVMNHIELGCYGSSCGLLFSSMVAMMWVTLVLSFLEHGAMVGHDTRILTPFFGQGFSPLRFFLPLLTRSLGTIRYLMIHAIRLQQNHI